jgi:hypothetical protein
MRRNDISRRRGCVSLRSSEQGAPSTLADQTHAFIFDRLAELKSEQSE